MSNAKYSKYENDLQQASNDLNLSPENQDWGIINADPSRTLEFIRYFYKTAINFDSFMLCEVIDLVMASYNELLAEKTNSFLLESEFVKFISTIKKCKSCEDNLVYWKNLDCINNEFPISAVLRINIKTE